MARPSEKEQAIVDAIRERILSGLYSPGSRLPACAALEGEFSASRMTLRRALGKLLEEGFLEGLERGSGVVSFSPPHLRRIGLMMAMPGRKNRFCACMEDAARACAEESGRQVPVFSNFSEAYCRGEEFAKLRRQVAVRMFAGLVVLFDPDKSSCPELFDAAIPKVYFGHPLRKDGTLLDMNCEAFARKALSKLRERGARRVAILSYPHINNRMEKASGLLGEYGLLSKPEWRIGMDNPEIAARLTRLLLSQPAAERPDGLLLSDDHLVEHAARGIVECGLRVPEELKVVALCNWPFPPSSPFPMDLLGYDCRQLLRLAVDAIDSANAGKPLLSISVEPRFENELSAFSQRDAGLSLGSRFTTGSYS